MLCVVDTHSLVWFLAGDSRLSPTAQAILANPGPGNRLAVPTIVLAEAWDLARKKRVTVSFNDVIRGVRASKALVWPLEVTTINLFPGQLPDIHDEAIIATALELQVGYSTVSIITKDNHIRALGIVPCVW